MTHYEPKVNDFVKWNSVTGLIEGWVYFVDTNYITIEISVKDKPDDLVQMHKKIHCLVCCFPWNWGELEYVRSR